ncbi:MAG TPA: Rieske 2Fe-2S domain-containing protein, partial [Acidimicrobiales bacterium]|nr:Rieske 2Fe-2S domain-containing protein [Acidimicrobiales bacterium]
MTAPAPIPTLPASAYLDHGFWEAEVERVFRTGWVPVCRVDQIPEPGDRYATTIAGHPVVAVRDGEDVRVLTNVCQHRWSLVAEPGCSHGRNLVCPYHRWSYGLDGRLQAAPLAGAFSLDDVALPVVRHEVWLGFVMVNLDGNADPLGPQLAGLADRLAPWRVDELVTVASRTFPSAWNWKVMVENWIECYHHLGSHRTTVETRNPARTTRISETDAPWAFMTVDTVAEAVTPPDEHAFPLGPSDAGRLAIWGAFPFLLGGNEADVSYWLEITPHSAERHHVTWHLMTSPANAE